MEPVLAVAGLWLLFIVSHIGLATAPVRAPLAARLGAHGFVWLFTAIASIEFVVLVAVYAAVRDQGAAGPALDGAARPVLLGVIGLGAMLMAGAFAPTGYWESPSAVLGDSARPAVGLERITRHPFFAGTVLVTGSLALLADRLSGTVFCLGFVTLAIAGPVHQTRKLRALRGPAYDRYLASTSSIPFLAILRGRQRLVLRELPWLIGGLGLAAAAGLYAAGTRLLAFHGAPVSGAVVAAAVLIGAIAMRRDARASLAAR